MRFAERTGPGARRGLRTALPLDRRVRGLQLPRPRAHDRRRALRGARAPARRAGPPRARAAPRRRRRARGWISGLSEAEGEAHPTRGGLRIGKPLPERAAGRAAGRAARVGARRAVLPLPHEVDARARPGDARDGAAALHRLGARARARRAPRLHVRAAPRRSPKRMYWKLSIDLSRPVVASMGQHDPLDGLVTYAQLEATRRGSGARASARRSTDFAAMIEPEALATADPLGLGGPVDDAYRRRPAGPAMGAQSTGSRDAARSGARRRPPATRAARTCELPARITVWPSASSASPSASPQSSAGDWRAGERRGEAGWISSRGTRRYAPRSRRSGSSPPTAGRDLARARGHQRGDAGDEPRAGGLPGAPVLTTGASRFRPAGRPSAGACSRPPPAAPTVACRARGSR